MTVNESLKKFRAKYPDANKVAFVMMRIRNTKPHNDIFAGIEKALAPFGIQAVRADLDWYDLEYLLENILTHVHGCGFGIAVFDRIEDVGFNANVMYEIGYMQGLGKPVCLLKDQALTKLPTDLVGKFYVKFDPQDMVNSISEELGKWLKGAGILDPKEPGEVIEVDEGMRQGPKSTVRHLKHENEVHKIYTLIKDDYPDAATSYEVLLKRWKSYRKSFHALFKHSELIGVIGISPVSEERFRIFVSGQPKKGEIVNASPEEKVSGHRYWYVGNVILKKEFRRSSVQFRLLEAATRAWLKSGDIAPRVTLCGLGYSKPAVDLLTHLRFIHHGKFFKNFPVYTRSATIEELHEDYEELIVNDMLDSLVTL